MIVSIFDKFLFCTIHLTRIEGESCVECEYDAADDEVEASMCLAHRLSLSECAECLFAVETEMTS